MEEAFQTYLTFTLGQENFAIDVEHVEKILEYQPITEVPKAPEYMLGVFNLRGEVIPLIDTRIKFGMERSVITTSTCVLVITINSDNEKIKLGAMVDGVKEVVKQNSAEIMPIPNIGKQNRTEFLHGVLKINEQFILVLNADKIFSVDEIIELRAENFELE